MGSLPEQCCTIPPTETTYKPTGRFTQLPVNGKEYSLYTAGPEDSKHVLVALYDICGMHANTLRGADFLASKSGLSIVVPDFFNGDGWDPSNIPPKEGRPALNAWIQKTGSWELVQPVLNAVVEHVKNQGATAIGAYGLCWGAKKLSQSASSHLFKAMAFVHPSLWQAEDADNIDVPIALMPSEGEDGQVMDKFWLRMQEKEFAERNVRKDFLDCFHGFASARSQWDDPRLGSKVREAHDILETFFAANLG